MRESVVSRPQKKLNADGSPSSDAGSVRTDPPVAPRPISPWLRRLPNQLTWLRIACIPIVVLLMLKGERVVQDAEFTPSGSDVWAAVVFSLAAITDFFDGWLARKFGVETVLGKLLDPLADKLLVVSALIILVDKHRLDAWVAVVLIVRDLGINAIRLAAMDENIVISSSWIGKTKTAFLDVGIVGLILFGPLWFLPAKLIGQVSMWCALVASVTSGVLYLIDYARKLNQPPHQGGRESE